MKKVINIGKDKTFATICPYCFTDFTYTYEDVIVKENEIMMQHSISCPVCDMHFAANFQNENCIEAGNLIMPVFKQIDVTKGVTL